MKIHNIVEDEVIEIINEIYDEEAKTGAKGICACHQCRLDVACYVLNRTDPEYVVSGRGVAHLKSDAQNNIQRQVDLVALVNEGIKKVSTTKRPHFNHNNTDAAPKPTGPLFNFPVIVGRIFNGRTFEPVRDVTISLTDGPSHVKMMDPNWQNPCPIVSSTAGNYSFWPYPEKAVESGEERHFGFYLTINEPGFAPVSHFIELTLKADENFIDTLKMERQFKVQDLFLFPPENEVESYGID